MCVARGERAVIPSALRQRVLSMAHEGRLGVVKTKQCCRSSVWWPKLDHHIEEFIKDCEACVVSGKSGHPRPGPLQAIPWPREPWTKLQVDIVGELYSAPVTHKYLIVVYGLHSKWPEVKACSHVDSKEVIVFLCDLFVRWGLPRVVITDNGPQFRSHDFATFLSSKGIQHSRTAVYHPQSNGGVERFNQVIKQGLRSHLTEGLNFHQTLQEILVNCRSTKHSTTGCSPAQLMLNRESRLPFQIIQPNPLVVVSKSTDEIATDVETKQEKMKEYSDKRRSVQGSSFGEGQLVRVRSPVR